MKRRDFLKIGLKLGGAALLSGCAGGSFAPIEIELNGLEDKITAPTETVISDRSLIRPCGIVSVNLEEEILPRQNITVLPKKRLHRETVFFDAPKYKLVEGGNDPPKIEFNTTPKLYRVSDDSVIFEFTSEEPFEDSYTFWDYVVDRIPQNLVVSMVNFGDSILLTSNCDLNRKILKLSWDKLDNLQREIYLEHDDLVLASDMVLGSDGKLYLTQAPIYEGWYITFPPEDPDEFNPNEGRLMRPARVISIDKDKNLNVEFELPSHQRPGNRAIHPIANNKLYPGYQSYWTGEGIKIVETSGDFFVSDLLEKKVYALSKSTREVSLFQDLSEHPPMCLLSNQGSLYIISTPLLRKDKTLFRNPKLIRIDSEKVQEVYDFSLDGFDFQGLSNLLLEEITIGESKLCYPLVYNMSATLDDVGLASQLTYTDSHRKQVRRVTFPGGISNHPIGLKDYK